MLLEVGRVAKAHGLAGQVVVELSTNRPERVAPGSILFAGSEDLRVVFSSRLMGSSHQPRWIVGFDGIDDRSAADRLRGKVLQAEAISDPDSLWVHELVGSRVVDQSGNDLGRVAEVQENPASDLLVLESGVLVPLRFVVSFCAETTSASAGGLLQVDIPDGLLDL